MNFYENHMPPEMVKEHAKSVETFIKLLQDIETDQVVCTAAAMTVGLIRV